MPMQRVIQPDEPAVLAICPRCHGTGLFCIERFMSSDDCGHLEELRQSGFTILSKPLSQVGNTDDCRCKRAKGQTPPKTTGRPLLSLKRRNTAEA